jgi:squalene synthase HpnC
MAEQVMANKALAAKAREEDFPIASLFLPADKRQAVMALYRFARTGDDIADDPGRPIAEKLAWMDAAETALAGDGTALAGDESEAAPPVAVELRRELLARGLGSEHALAFLGAFRMDCETSRYADWDALAGYYALSANPVGRFLMDLFGEQPSLYFMSDQLCTGLGAITNLRDCREDLVELDRIYLPQDEMMATGLAEDDLRQTKSTAAARSMFDTHLSQGETLLGQAESALGEIRSSTLRRHTALAIACGRRLAAKLRSDDLLAGRIRLGKFDLAVCGFRALWA